MKKILLSVILLIAGSVLSYAATYTVTSNADAGAGTLRQAILDANANAGADDIVFNFGAPTTITLTSCLPQITGQVTIDGYSEPSSAVGSPAVEVISPAGCNNFSLANNLCHNSIIRGLVISGGNIGIRSDENDGLIISGNFIGTNMAGTAAAATPPTGDGMELRRGAGITVGGTGGLADRNVVAANGSGGIFMWGCDAPEIKGNVVGMSADGTVMLGNGQAGIYLSNCLAAQIGGLTVNERNYTSCNADFGIHVDNGDNTVIEGNWIGVDMATGNLNFGNGDAGINVIQSADVRIGGSVAGAGNITSANGTGGTGADGISLWNNSPRAIIKGNIIGLGADGVTFLPNDAHGIECLTSPDAIIGGPTVLERNVVAGSMNRGLQIVSCPRIQIINNYVGTDVSGLLPRGGDQIGISVTHCPDAVIGGPTAAERNVVAANAQTGIFLSGTSSNTLVQGNYVGVGADGATPLGNGGIGIDFDAVSDNAVWDNVVSDNADIGIKFANSVNNTIYRNHIGTDATGTADLGNGNIGLRFGANSNDNEVGGSLANANVIAYNGAQAGVLLESNCQRVEITYNSIFCNTGPGIALQGAANESVLPPVVTSSTANEVSGTGVDGHAVHVYWNVTADGGDKCDCEGEIYLGTTTVSGGVWTVVHNMGLSNDAATAVTATQTTPNNSTSEFSPCTPPLPVQLLMFDGWNEGTYNRLVWATVEEINNDYFVLERSTDGQHFESIATINGAGDYSGRLDYSFNDHGILPGVYYYRLKQVDFDGTSVYTHVVVIRVGGLEIRNLYPNPVTDAFQFVLYSVSDEDIVCEVIDVLGKTHYRWSASVEAGTRTLAVDASGLASGTYILRVVTASGGRAVFKEFVVSK